MKADIILAGVGGQGILSIATIIGYAALKKGLYLKQAEVHGMSQRGGDVQSHLRISDKPIYSDLVPFGQADMILSVEPMESLRYLPYLADAGWLITNTKPFVNIVKYPELETILEEIKKVKHNIAIDADDMAKSIKAPRSMNMIMMGAASIFLELSSELFEEGIKTVFASKGEEIVNVNLQAYNLGKEYSMSHKG